MPSTCNSPARPYHCRQLRQPSITSHPPSAARLARYLLGRAAASLRALRTRSAAAEPVASPVLSPHSMRHQPHPLGRSCLFLPWPAPGHHAPTGGPPVRPPAVLAASPSAIAFVSYAPPGPACHSFLSPGLSSTVINHAFVSIHRPGSSTLFGLAVRFQRVDLQSSHEGGAPRIILLSISSRADDLIHCASASATNSASFIACPS